MAVINFPILVTIVILIEVVTIKGFQSCPSVCTCKWKNGKFFSFSQIQQYQYILFILSDCLLQAFGETFISLFSFKCVTRSECKL